MSKFNQPETIEAKLENNPTATTNYEGGLAFTMTPELELYTRVATSLVGEPKYYDPSSKDTDNAIIALIETVSKSNPQFILQLAAYARNELYLRSIPMVLLVEACRHKETKQYVRAYTPEIIQRADELTEVLAYYIQRNGPIGNQAPKGMLAHSLQKGLQKAFHKFNEYHFAKYDRDGNVKLRDALRIIHPKPHNDEESQLYQRIRDRTLKTPETWETVISTKGSTTENWASILPKMPFMARLRNLRNLLEHGVDVTTVIQMLENPDQVARSKQFPYRFYSAYKEIFEIQNLQTPKVLRALQIAMELSIKNVPHWPGVSMIVTDNSGSMMSTVSEKSKIARVEIGAILGSMAYTLCDGAYVGVFGDTYQFVQLDPTSGILTNAKRLHETDVGHSTNAWLVAQAMVEQKVKVDRLLIFSDMQCYDTQGYLGYGRSLVEYLTKYRHQINPNLYVYSFDLVGYGTSQFPQSDPRTALLAGWSDKVLSLVNLFEQRKSITEKIGQITAKTYTKEEEE